MPYNHFVFSQAGPGGIASNPANNINNIPLNSHPASNIKQDDLSFVLGVLKAVALSNNEDLRYHISSLDKIIPLLSPDHQDSANVIKNAILFNSRPDSVSLDPATGQRTLSPQELAQQLWDNIAKSNEIQEHIKGRVSQKLTSDEPAEDGDDDGEELADDDEEDDEGDDDVEEHKKKKKTRGNPFKVLMGQIGKLLDHGMSRNDIVKYIARQKIWNKETIDKAAKIVQDYNTKKRRKESCFNLIQFRYAQKVEKEYFEPNLQKRSTSELLSRVKYLESVIGFNKDKHSDGRKAVDIDKARKQLSVIKSILNSRGFEEGEF